MTSESTKSGGLPPIIARQVRFRRMMASLSIALGLLGIALLVAYRSGEMGGIAAVLIASSVATTLIGLGIERKKTSDLRRSVIESGGALCTHCGFSLGGLRESTQCPECGKQFELEDTLRQWRRVFGDWEYGKAFE